MASDDSDRSRPPRPRRVGESWLGKDWVSKILPDTIVYRSLDVSLTAPDTVQVGEPTMFTFRVRNRLPIPVSLSLPTSRVWGWMVDELEEADERGYAPPTHSRTISISSRGNQLFEWTWDGMTRHVRDERDGRNEWVPATGSHTVTAYIALSEWKKKGAFGRASVTVVE